MRRTSLKQLAVILAVALCIISINLFFVTAQPQPEAPASNQKIPVTDITDCRGCHQAIVDSFLKTAHYFDSRPADSNSIKGSFEEGENRYKYNPFMEVIMYKEGDKYLQAALVNGMLTTSAPFDFVIGSGRNGQTYLTWVDNQLFQLPISYYAPSRQWCNSPGFPNYFFFGRQIPANCLECHTTKAKVLSDETMEYDKASIVYGITCERCHPGADEHAAFHKENPREKTSKIVVNAAHMGRQLRMDACALCHSGFRTQIQPAFSFAVGDTLDKFSRGGPVSQRTDTLDVHGNQYGLLIASKCYTRSSDMDCSTCHNVHNNEFGNVKLYSSKCVSCHNDNGHMKCSVKTKKKIVLSDNCIDCHMPVLASKAIQLNVKSGEQLLPDFLHTHYISIYKQAAADFIKNH